MAHKQTGETETGDTLSAGESDQTWLETAERVLDASIDREEPIECTFEEFGVEIPMAMGPDSERARWAFDGSVRVSVEGTRGPLADWLRWWHGAVSE